MESFADVISNLQGVRRLLEVQHQDFLGAEDQSRRYVVFSRQQARAFDSAVLASRERCAGVLMPATAEHYAQAYEDVRAALKGVLSQEEAPAIVRAFPTLSLEAFERLPFVACPEDPLEGLILGVYVAGVMQVSRVYRLTEAQQEFYANAIEYLQFSERWSRDQAWQQINLLTGRLLTGGSIPLDSNRNFLDNGQSFLRDAVELFPPLTEDRARRLPPARAQDFLQYTMRTP